MQDTILLVVEDDGRPPPERLATSDFCYNGADMDSLIEATGIWKSFPGVHALEGVDFDVRPGEVHVLVGENGAGKSTLIKILSGVYQPDRGQILMRGEPVMLENPHEALSAGVATVYQEFNLVSHMTVAQNIFLGHEPTNGGFLDRASLRKQAKKLMDDLGIEIDPNAIIADLGVAYRQIVEILRGLAVPGFRVLILDEPTAALARHEIDILFRVIGELRDRGVGLVYISHRLEEIHQIGDRVTVLRDGHRVVTKDVAEVDSESVIEWMVGRTMTQFFPSREVAPSEELLKVENLTLKSGKARNVSLSVRRGEVVGLFGLIGAGRTETIRGIFGLDRLQHGYIEVSGNRVAIRSPRDAVNRGLGLAPEDRKSQGILPYMNIAQNINLAALDKVMVGPFISPKMMRAVASRYVRALRIVSPHVMTEIRLLSGGNQQKCVLARLLFADSEILLLDEPTRGIDVGAKREVYNLINEFAEQGKAILLISSDLPEVMGMSDVVVVFRKGQVAAIFDRDLASEQDVMRAAVPNTLADDQGVGV